MPGNFYIFKLASAPSSTAETGYRSRRSHKKSRQGCHNCKRRRVKCDETPGGCIRCKQKNVECIYESYVSGPVAGKPNQLNEQLAIWPRLRSRERLSSHRMNAAIIERNLIDGPDSGESRLESIIFGIGELAILHHFRDFTCQTIGGGLTQSFYSTEVVEMAFQHSYLMQAILTLSVAHLRILKSAVSPPSNGELLYWQRTLKAFREKLSRPIHGTHVNAMLATATLVNGVAFVMRTTSDPRTCWPWRKSTGSDLQWLRVQGGIDIVLQNIPCVEEPTAFRSLFDDDVEPCASEDSNMVEEALDPCQSLVTKLEEICNAIAEPTPTTNPYILPLRLLTPFLPKRCTSKEDILHYLGFIGSASNDFIALLEAREHRALLLLCLWYATISSAPCWWTMLRSRVECKAIVTYLDEHADAKIKECLPYAAAACGYTLKGYESRQEIQSREMLEFCFAI